MAFRVVVRKDLGLVFTEYRDVVDDSQLVMARDSTLEHPDFVAGMVELTDLSGLTGSNVDFDRMKSHRSRMAEYYDVETDHHIVASSELGFGLVRIYLSLAEDGVPNVNLHLHRSEQEALNAMGRPESSIAELLGADAARP